MNREIKLCESKIKLLEKKIKELDIVEVRPEIVPFKIAAIKQYQELADKWASKKDKMKMKIEKN